MPSFKPKAPWSADPHTLAKIELVGRYVGKWVSIVGRAGAFRGRKILIVDGFAGPGVYSDGELGSPIAAIRAASASMAIAKNAGAWQADEVYFELVERSRPMYESLQSQIGALEIPKGIHVSIRHGSFEKQLHEIRGARPWAFRHGFPLFAFVDPFGAKGVPFSAVREVLGSGTSELFLNLDADGIARLESYRTDGNTRLLNELFGDVLWVEEIKNAVTFTERCRLILTAYRSRLHQIPGVKYSFPFEIQQFPGLPDYFLLFATMHQRGIEKMKESMMEISQDGSLRFCDAWNGQRSLFRHDDPADWATKLREAFAGAEKVAWQAVVDFTLNETPFVNPKAMLRVLDSTGLIEVTSSNPNRKRNTFPDGTIQFIKFN
jgi:three-Cys-motif partner protein